MQATKPISSGKKCQKSQQVNGVGSCTSAKDKSVAQRVMDVTIPAGNASTLETKLAPTPTQMQQQQQQQQKQQKQHLTGSTNSVENDHEVEAITNRVSQKLNISPVNSNTSSTSNVNCNPESQTKKLSPALNGQQFAADEVLSKSSSSLVLVSPISGSTVSSQQQQSDKRFKINNEFSPNGGFSCHLSQQAGSTLLAQSRIGLDTKVPHPHKLSAANFQPVPFQDDEVSYYNDMLALEKQPNSDGGSIDKNARPKLLLAASQLVGSQLATNVSSNNNNNNNNKPSNGTQAGGLHSQRLQLGLQQGAGQKADDAKLEVYQNDTKLNGRPMQATSNYHEHNYMSADYDAIYDVHYHNAPMVEKEAAATKQQLALSSLDNRVSNEHSRYQQIASPTTSGPQLTPTSKDCTAQQMVSISTSPKAKSAPATPCNVTPTAFHQTGSQLNAALDPPLANTMPPDIRRNISSTCRVLPSSIGLNASNGHPGNQSLDLWHNQRGTQALTATTVHPTSYKNLDSLIKAGELALAEKNHISAINLFSECIKLAKENQQNVNKLKKNFKLYSQRAEAHFKLGNYEEAIEDSKAARELNPKWAQAYYLQGQAQFMIGQYADSLAVFAIGLTQDPANKQLFEALVDAALSGSCDFRQGFKPNFDKLKSVQLERSPFFVMTVLGQELLSKGHSRHAAIILDSALKLSMNFSVPASPRGANHELLQVNTPDNQKRFRSSVLSTISLAHCMMHDYEKAISYMNKELDIETELKDVSGQCRVLSNLGHAYYKVRKYDKSLEAHRRQLNLAIGNELYPQASQALNAIGHVHAAKNDHSNALTSHTRCLDILKELNDDCYAQFEGLLAIGHTHLMLNETKAAEEKFEEANHLLKQKHSTKNINHELFTVGSILIYFNLAHLELRKQSYATAIKCYESVLRLTHLCNSGGTGNVKLATYQMRAYNGLGQACRLLKNFREARMWFEKQLELAKTFKDQTSQNLESLALCNLGMIHQHFGDFDKALDMFDQNLRIVENDCQLKAYAHSYIGSAYYLKNRLEKAHDQYEEASRLFRELGYCSAEQRTIDLNLASIKRRAGLSEVLNSTPSILMTNQNNLPTASSGQKKVLMAS